MKVTDIISESQTINEVDWSKPLVVTGKALGKLFNAERRELINILTDAVKGTKYSGPVTDREIQKAAKALGPKAEEMLVKDPSIMADVAKRANKIRDPSGARKAAGTAGKVVAGTWRGTKSLPGLAGDIARHTGNVALAAAILEPCYDYYEVMEKADEWLEAGQVPPQFASQFNNVEEWYKRYRERELTGMVSKMAVSFAGGAVGKLLGGLVGLPASKLLNWMGLTNSAKIIGSAGAVAGGTLAQIANDSTFAKKFAEIMVSNPLGIPVTGIIGAPIASAFDTDLGKAISSILGVAGAATRVGVNAVNSLRGKDDKTPSGQQEPTGQQSTKPPAAAGTADTGAKSDKDATSTPATADDKDKPKTTIGGVTLSPGASPPNKWYDVGGGFVKDPKTGQIANRYALGLN